jgi:hypothetical protein
MIFEAKEENLCRLLESTKLLSAINRDIVVKILYDTTKLIWYKQNHTKKVQLKPKEIARCLSLVYYHHLWNKIIVVTGKLFENMGGEFLEGEALDYYQKKVMGTVKDKLGQDIVIDELGMDFLYMDHNNADSLNYRQARGKRLPWIKYVLQNSNEIYTKQEGNTLLYIYVMTFVIPISPVEKTTNWFLVFVKKRKDIEKTLGFLTAIPVEKYNGFLSKLEAMSPVIPLKT